jgi:hypothetical protein
MPFLESAAEIPYGYALLAVCLASILAQVGVILAQRSRPAAGAPRLRLNLAGAATIVVAFAMGAFCVHTARVMMSSASIAASPSEAARLYSQGISGQMNGVPMMSLAAMFSIGLCVAGVIVELERFPSPDRRRVVFGLGAFGAIAMWSCALLVHWSATLIKTFAGVAGVDPALKGGLLSRGFDDATAGLRALMPAVAIGFVAATTAAVVLSLFSASPSPPPGQKKAPLLVTLAGLALACLFWRGWSPLHAENTQPWPEPTTGDAVLNVVEPKTPDLVGPDAVERAPVVQVFKDKVALDGYEVEDWADLKYKLQTLASNYRLLHPGESFNHFAVVVLDRALPIGRVVEAGQTLHDASFTEPLFTFTRLETLQRPVLGTLHRVVATGVRVQLFDSYDLEAEGDDLPKDLSWLRRKDFATYDDFARAAVKLRAGGASKVAFDLGKPPKL